jgi:anaerobic ribonucleoside-triphosphate reductase activating protein
MLWINRGQAPQRLLRCNNYRAVALLTTLRLFRHDSPVHVLGPGARAVVWVQGCPFKCPGCIVPESWDAQGGYELAVDELAEWVRAQRGIDGLTLSGGEPMVQAGPLAALVRTVKAGRDLSVLCYSGYRQGDLLHRGTPEQRELLGLCDILIDGPYIRSQHADLRWRGSRNQRVIALTARHQAEVDALNAVEGGDHSAGLEFALDETGLALSGVPSRPGFREEFMARLAAKGVLLASGEGEQ